MQFLLGARIGAVRSAYELDAEPSTANVAILQKLMTVGSQDRLESSVRPAARRAARALGARRLPGSASNVSLRWMERLIVARHAESEYNVKGLINADPSSLRSPLTLRGTDQARSMAERLAADDIDLCVTSGTLRAVQTGEVVAEMLSIPFNEDPTPRRSASRHLRRRTGGRLRQLVARPRPRHARAGNVYNSPGFLSSIPGRDTVPF
jgi:Histidine phosphatase superfamily (branch 1)